MIVSTVRPINPPTLPSPQLCKPDPPPPSPKRTIRYSKPIQTPRLHDSNDSHVTDQTTHAANDPKHPRTTPKPSPKIQNTGSPINAILSPNSAGFTTSRPGIPQVNLPHIPRIAPTSHTPPVSSFNEPRPKPQHPDFTVQFRLNIPHTGKPHRLRQIPRKAPTGPQKPNLKHWHPIPIDSPEPHRSRQTPPPSLKTCGNSPQVPAKPRGTTPARHRTFAAL